MTLHSPDIPTYVDLMFPTLQALDAAGGEAHYEHINKGVVDIAAITDDQLNVEYPEGSAAAGSKVIHRMAFARTYLSKIGAIESIERGVWALAAAGREFLERGPEEGGAALRRAELEVRRGFPDVSDFLTRASERAHDQEPLELSVRELIGVWGVKRRGTNVADRIAADLRVAGLRTDPPFAKAWIDETVSIELVQEGVPRETAEPELTTEEVELSLSISSLSSANRGVTSVLLDDSLTKAQSLLMRHDYSQLAVMSGPRSLRGAISWESIAQARLRDPGAGLRDCVFDAPVVRADDELLRHVDAIVTAGFVFVEGPDGTIGGIVTTADLSDQFAQLANPFLLLGEIERCLRAVINRRFTPEELLEYQDPEDVEREIIAAENLTLGEHMRVFSHPEAWDRLGWEVDRKVFIEHLDTVRRIRNEVMHFSPDPLDESDLIELENFRRWIRYLVLM